MSSKYFCNVERVFKGEKASAGDWDAHTHTHNAHAHTHTTHARTHARTNLNRGDGDCLWIKPVNVDGAVVQLLLGSDWLAWVTANGIAILAGSSNRKTKGGGQGSQRREDQANA